MKGTGFMLFVVLIALSNADRRTDWVISPNVSPSGIKHTISSFWDYRNNLLYYLAPEVAKIFTLNPVTNETNSADVDNDAVFIQPTEKPDCIVYGVGNQIKIVEWDGKGAKKGGDVLVTMNEVGSNAKILAGVVSLQGNLTFIVQGMRNDKQAWYIYTMMLDKPPFMLNFTNKVVSEQIDSLFWTCKNKNLFVASFEKRLTWEMKFYPTVGVVMERHVQVWAANYHPLGESKESMDNKVYQNMYYSNNDMGELFQMVDFWISDYAVAPIKMLTSNAWGGADMKTLYFTSKKMPADQSPAGGGIFSCDSIGVTGRPAFIALSSLNPNIDYCETPKPDIVVPMTPEEIKKKCKQILSGSVSAQGSVGGGSGAQTGKVEIDVKFCAKFNAEFNGGGSGGITGKPGGGITGNPGVGISGKPGGGITRNPGVGISGKPGGGITRKPGADISGKPGGGITGKPGGGITGKPGGGITGKPGGGITGKPGVDISGKPGGGITRKPGGGRGGITGKPGGGGGGITGKPGGGSGGKPGGGSGNKPGKPGGGSGGITGGSGGVTGSAGGGAGLTASTPCFIMPPTPPSSP